MNLGIAGSQSNEERKPHPEPNRKGEKWKTIIIIQFLVGALVTFGGVSFVSSALTTYGKSLGSIHLTIGVIALIGGFVAIRANSWSRNFLFISNGLIIGYSSLSESLVYIQSLLPATASFASLIGTIIAIMISGILVSLLRKQKIETRKSRVASF